MKRFASLVLKVFLMYNTKKMKKKSVETDFQLTINTWTSVSTISGKKDYKICVSVITDNPREGFLLLDTLNFQEHSCNKEAPDHCLEPSVDP